LDLRGGKLRETGENCIMKGFIICTTHQVLLVRPKEEGDERCKYTSGRDAKLIQHFGRKTWGKNAEDLSVTLEDKMDLK
jgi:hypothetical protein